MIDENSRYYNLENLTFRSKDGREIVYKDRRFPPQGSSRRVLMEVEVGQGDRLDQIAARALGDPLQFWRLCDAADALNPHDLTAEPGVNLPVPAPEF